MELETIAVTAASVFSIYYGLLGLTMICTSDCSNVEIETDGQTLTLSPWMATMYCIMALAAGWGLWKLRGVMANGGGFSTASMPFFSMVAGTATREGQYFHAMSMRYAIISFFLFSFIVVWMKMQLIGKLKKCTTVGANSGNDFMWRLRIILEGLEWIVYVIIAFFIFGFIKLSSERDKWEGLAHRANPTAASAAAQTGLTGSSIVTKLVGGLNAPTINFNNKPSGQAWSALHQAAAAQMAHAVPHPAAAFQHPSAFQYVAQAPVSHLHPHPLGVYAQPVPMMHPAPQSPQAQYAEASGSSSFVRPNGLSAADLNGVHLWHGQGSSDAQ